MEKKSIITIAHKDLDGLTSTLCFTFSDRYQIDQTFFIEAGDLLDFLQEHSDELKAKLLVIIDLQLTQNVIETIFAITSDFLIFDHHVTSKNALKSVSNRNIYWRSRMSSKDLNLILSSEEYARLKAIEQCSCSDLCFQFNSYKYLDEASYQTIKRLVQHTRIVDTGLYTTILNKSSLNFARLCDHYSVMDYYNKLYGIVRTASTFFDEEDRMYLHHCADTYLMEVTRIMQDGVLMTVKNMSIFIFSTTRDMSELSEEFTSSYDLVIAVNQILGKVTFRTVHSKYNLGPFVARYFHGGGHSTCAGFSINEISGLSPVDFISLLENL